MTLKEAIEHAEERACGNDQCAKDHAQLSDWLRELRRARMEIDLLKTLRDGFKADAQKHKAENEKLREFAQAMAEVAYEGQMLCNKCRFFHGCYNGGKKEHDGRGCQWLLWARELGIEVSE